MKSNAELEAEWIASLTPDELAKHQHEQLRRKATMRGRFVANRHFERREKLGIQRPNAGVWDALHNGFYTALAGANKESEFGTPMLADSDLSRIGITATVALAAFYSTVEARLETLKRHNGYADNIAEHEKLLDLLAPVVAGLMPKQEARAYTDKMTAEYLARETEAHA